jgi:hypothetical protein
MKIMKINVLKEKILYTLIIGISIFILFFIVSCSWIGYEVKDICQEAKTEYGKDCIGSLIDLLQDKNRGFKLRNDAIWALGQLGDKRALPILQQYYTGKVPAREPLGKTISQYELKKAINLTSGGVNITSFIWRGLFTVE